MTKMNVLLLGWDFPPVVNDGLGAACYGISKALANRVNLSLILPKSEPEFILKNVELTGLNNVDLRAIKSFVPKPDFTPFSEKVPVRTELMPYGAPMPTGNQEAEEVEVNNIDNLKEEQPGQTVTIGTFAYEKDIKTVAEAVEDLNVFGQQDLNLVAVNSQVIHFARYASRFASQRDYDVIYAYDWMTFLAGIELKLVSGKPLVLHMHSLSFDRGGPDSKGWIYELEKQALEKADAIIAASSNISDRIVEDYGINPDKLRIIEEETEETVTPTTATATTTASAITTPPLPDEISDEIYNMEVSESSNDVIADALPTKIDTDTKEKDYSDLADKVWEVLIDVTTTEPEEEVF